MHSFLSRLVGRLPNRILEGILRRPWTTVGAAAAFTAVALFLGSGVRLETSRKELAPPDDPVQARWQELNREVSTSNVLVVALEPRDPRAAPPPAVLREAADTVAARLGRLPEAESVFHRMELEWFLRRALHLVPAETLEAAVAALREEDELRALLSEVDGLASLNNSLAARLEAGLSGGTRTPPEEAGRVLEGLAEVLRWEARLLAEPRAVLARLEEVRPLEELAGRYRDLGSRGYLTTRDGGTAFIVVTPRGDDDSLPAVRGFVAGARRSAEQALAPYPRLRVALAGEPATTVEEMATVRRDTLFTSSVAVLGVALLTLLVFRWKLHSLLVLLALAAGIAWSFGAVRLELGYLNLITTSFISTLVGVGIAYGIHPVSEYELLGAHRRDPTATVGGAYRHTAAAVSVAAITTSAAFFSILLMRFRGFAELGLVAGFGVLLCLASALLFLPALLVLHGRRRCRALAGPEEADRKALLDRLWEERLSAWVTRRPWAVVALGLLVTAAAAVGALGIDFDTNILELLPRGAESVRMQERMILESDLSPLQGLVVAEDLAELRELRLRAGREETLARFESVLGLLPENAEASREAVQQTGELLARIRLPGRAESADREAIAASLGRLEETLLAAAEEAFLAGLGHLAGPLEEARAAAEEARTAALEAPSGAERLWTRAQGRMLELGRELLGELRIAAATPAPEVESLPGPVRERFVTSKGRLLAYLHPAGDVFDEEFRREFLAAARRVSPEVTGFPVVFDRMAHRITEGFTRAVAAGALIVFALLWLDLGRLRDALLAMSPLVLGVVWMLGAMRLLGVDFNFANLVAVPLVIGVGIDNGVHIMHRVRLEGTEGMHVVVRHTGRAILIASLTTMIGFGSLALASHRGLASLGTVLFLGVGACLATSTLLLPNLLIVLGRVRR